MNAADLKVSIAAVITGTAALAGFVWAAAGTINDLETQVLLKTETQQQTITQQQKVIDGLLAIQEKNVEEHNKARERLLLLEDRAARASSRAASERDAQ